MGGFMGRMLGWGGLRPHQALKEKQAALRAA